MWNYAGRFRSAEAGTGKAYTHRRGWGRRLRPLFDMRATNFRNELQFRHKYNIINQRMLRKEEEHVLQ